MNLQNSNSPQLLMPVIQVLRTQVDFILGTLSYLDFISLAGQTTQFVVCVAKTISCPLLLGKAYPKTSDKTEEAEVSLQQRGPVGNSLRKESMDQPKSESDWVWLLSFVLCI